MNDAPALRLAHVGLVVHNASDVAREAADILLLDQSLHVIIEGIVEGRRIFANISKYIKYTLIGNFGNFFAIAGISLIIPFLPMLPTQILLTNLLTDLPLIAVATDRVGRDDVRRPHLFSIREFALMGLVLGGVSSLFDFIFFAAFHGEAPAVVQTMWFMVSIVTELLLVFSIRTRKVFIFNKLPSPVLLWLVVGAGITTIALPYIPFTRELFHFILPQTTWAIRGLLIALGYIVTTEIAKALYYHFAGPTAFTPTAPQQNVMQKQG
jgi:Mg2+-importing ATPase